MIKKIRIAALVIVQEEDGTEKKYRADGLSFDSVISQLQVIDRKIEKDFAKEVQALENHGSDIAADMDDDSDEREFKSNEDERLPSEHH